MYFIYNKDNFKPYQVKRFKKIMYPVLVIIYKDQNISQHCDYIKWSSNLLKLLDEKRK